MLDYIQGLITRCTPTDVIIDSNSFGYRVEITLQTHEEIKNSKQVKLYTHLHVKNEGQNLSGFVLYGFASEEERNYFKKIIGVSGIGTSTARLMLSSFKPVEVAQAIMNDDVQTISSVKGLGPKTAKRMILELKDKLVIDDETILRNNSNSGNTIANEALSALLMLGFSKQAAHKAIQSTLKETPNITVEKLIKLCLKKL